MKANLQTAEPETIAEWERDRPVPAASRERRAGAPKYVLHDGPPYANGQIHLGTALNKILKDLVVKARSMAGYDAPYIPGYDCHGLPIELKVDRELGAKKRQMSPADFRRACRAYAERFIGVMTEEFQRLGVFGDWQNPYLTMNFRYQAAIARALGKCVERGPGLQGQEARPLVHPLPDGAGRSGSRVRGAHLALDLRRVPARRVEPRGTGSTRACSGRPRRGGADLDDDAVDDSVEPGRRVSPGVRLRGVRARRARGVHRGGPGGEGVCGGEEGMRRGDREGHRRRPRRA